MNRKLHFTIAAAAAAACAIPLPVATAADSVPGEIVVGFARNVGGERQQAIAEAAGASSVDRISTRSQVFAVAPGESTAAAIRRLKSQPGVRYAVPNLLAHASGLGGAALAADWIPNDLGIFSPSRRAYLGWSATQWNFLAASGVNAPAAWANAAAAGRRGGAGVKIAVIDSGIAFANMGPRVRGTAGGFKYSKSPDFAGTRFSAPYDFIHNTSKNVIDRNGHGTHVAGTIGEATNNRKYMTGLAWGATLIPERVLDYSGTGSSSDIARAIRYAADQRAAVANLSIEFEQETTLGQIPEVKEAIDYAIGKGTLVVAAAGNDASSTVSYPARYAPVLSVGATTQHRCLADYSNFGTGLDIVAPGGGPDADIPADLNCKPNGRTGSDIVQLGLSRAGSGWASVPFRFIYDAEDGTSMAAPHVSAAAALVIASGVLGANPTPAQVADRLMATADPTTDADHYGAGLLDAGRATQATP